MALTIPQPRSHNSHTVTENAMRWMAGAALAASVALGTVLVLDNDTTFVAPAQLDQVSEISTGVAAAEAAIAPEPATASAIIQQEIDKARSAIAPSSTTGDVSASEIIQQEIDNARSALAPGSAAEIIQREIDKALR